MSGRVDLSELSSDFGGVVGRGIDATPETQPGQPGKSEVQVWVLTVTLLREYGWSSVHATYDGAVARLEERVRSMDLWDQYQATLARDYVARAEQGVVAAGDEDDDVVFGISHLPVEV